MEGDINFRLSEKEAELLMNALQTQTNNVIAKMQNQYAEQVNAITQNDDEEQILVEDNNDKGDRID